MFKEDKYAAITTLWRAIKNLKLFFLTAHRNLEIN